MTPTQLRRAITKLGWNQAELAARARISQNVAADWIDGKTERVSGIAAAFIDLSLRVKKMHEVNV